jgi:O-acetyl-ADP-ribose deacetylase (regulator of RNase III)
MKPFDETSRLVMLKAGDNLGAGVRNILNENENIFEGESYLVKLKNQGSCKSLVLAILPNRIDKSTEIKFLKDSVNESLRISSNYSSIAIPLFYTYREKIDEKLMNMVINAIVDKIVSYLGEHRKNKFKEIYLVDDKYYDLISKSLKYTIEKYKKNTGYNPETTNIKESTKETELTASKRIIIEVGNKFDTKTKVDAIVNTTRSNLDIRTGTLSKLIFQKAGQSIQDELNENYKNGLNRKRLVAVSRSGNIKSLKNIFHIALSDYEPAMENDIKRVFKKTIKSLLESTEKYECKSVGFPAFGTGILKYPSDKVAKWMITSINDYFSNNCNNLSFLSHVVIVLNNEDSETIQSFKNNESLLNYDNNMDNDDDESSKDPSFQEENEIDSLKLSEDNFYSGFKSENGLVKMKFKTVEIQVIIGDIVKSKEDVIINPTNSSFQVDGQISKAIITSAGEILQYELGRSPKLDRNGIYWTSAGVLVAKKILHVDVQSAEIKETIINSLASVNKKLFQSVVFPVIGTGIIGKDSSNTIREILDGFALYIYKLSETRLLNLDLIKVCINENLSDMLRIFENEMKLLANTKKFTEIPWYPKIYENVKNLFQSF